MDKAARVGIRIADLYKDIVRVLERNLAEKLASLRTAIQPSDEC